MKSCCSPSFEASLPAEEDQTAAQAVKATVQLMGRRAHRHGGAPVHARKGLYSENGLVASVSMQ